MSRMLTFTQDGWSVAKRFARIGRRIEALKHLNRLLVCPDLPVGIAGEARRLAAEIELERQRFGAARRHLKAALGLEPNEAEIYYLIGRSFEEDPEGADERALRWYRKALSLSPSSAHYSAALGRAAIRCNHVTFGTTHLSKAAEEAAGDLTVIRIVVEGFLEAGNTGEARRVITRSRFLCPGRVLDQLDQRTRFEDARRSQRRKQEAPIATDGEVRSLPFLRVVGGSVRRDMGSRPTPHLQRLRFDRG